jgi:hypothetical protein
MEHRSRGITDIAEADDAFAALKDLGAKVIIVAKPVYVRASKRANQFRTSPGTSVDRKQEERALIGYGPD